MPRLHPPALRWPACAGGLLAGLVAAFLAGCGAGHDARPSVVIVLVDQLRQDAAERWMPATGALAERGLRFEQMRSAAPWTYPSVISLLSGLYPQEHGADGNQEGGRLSIFSRDVPLLPRTLRAAGYRTLGFVTNPFLHEWNPVHECFDHYDASFIGNQGPTRGHGELVWTERMYADSVNTALEGYLDAHPPEGPEFLYVHYIDVHGRKNGEGRWVDAPFEPSYEAAVRYVDGKIAALYERMRARSGGRLLFVVTSDHGQDEEGGDDELVGEGPPWRERKASLHDFNLRIPCWILPGPGVPARTLELSCSNVDLTPTLLDWLGLPPHPDVSGRSLLAAIQGAALAPRAIYARNSAFGRLEDCVVERDEKYLRYQRVRRQDVNVRRRFDLGADPRELHDLGPDSALEQVLGRLAAPGEHPYPARFQDPSQATRDQLEQLGYGGDR